MYQIDAFASQVFSGNPAAVVPLETWLPDDVMQKIGMENNLAETAFIVREGKHYRIRWFTPLVEVDLCGHATLASAYVLFNHLGYQDKVVTFESRSGPLSVAKDGDQYSLDFPTDTLTPVDSIEPFFCCFDQNPVEAWKGKTDYMLVFESEDQIKNLVPDMTAIANINARGIIATAKGTRHDFVSRFFAPQSGVPEDPVTGSAHTTLIPYWSKKLEKTKLQAAQISKRNGELACELLGDRVKISGSACTYLIGEIHI